MTKAAIQLQRQMLAKTNEACEHARQKNNKMVKEFRVIPKTEFWKMWAPKLGFSKLVKKSHKFVAVLRLSIGGAGERCYSVSNAKQPEIAALKVLQMAMSGWTPVPDSDTIKQASHYAKIAPTVFKLIKKVFDCYNRAIDSTTSKFQVNFKLTASCHVTVEAKTTQEAIEKAEQFMVDADFGPAENIEWSSTGMKRLPNG